MHRLRRATSLIAVSLTAAALAAPSAQAVGGGGSRGGTEDNGHVVSSEASGSRIRITQVSGGTKGKTGNLAPVDTDWKPPACWYEPVLRPEQLRDEVEADRINRVGLHQWWYGKGLWTDHYKDGKPDTNFDDGNTAAEGYKDYNTGKGGWFWRGVAPDDQDPKSWECGRLMFWEPDHVIPKIPQAPEPKTLAMYAYNKVHVPDTEVQLKPTAKQTVNLPTWVSLDKGTFQPVKVRAELPEVGLWAETTAKPVSLHLDPGTSDAETFPASGDCTMTDGSIGRPYQQGDAGKEPPCGITYLRKGTYQLKASVTWDVTWVGSDNDGTHTLPSGTFRTTQDLTVREIQSVNR